jgi:hypothetical protein
MLAHAVSIWYSYKRLHMTETKYMAAQTEISK